MPPTFTFKSTGIASLDALKWRDLRKDDIVQNGTRLRWKVRAFLLDLVVTVTGTGPEVDWLITFSSKATIRFQKEFRRGIYSIIETKKLRFSGGGGGGMKKEFFKKKK